MTTTATMPDEDEAMPSTAAKQALNWEDDPAIVHLNAVLVRATAPDTKILTPDAVEKWKARQAEAIATDTPLPEEDRVEPVYGLGASLEVAETEVPSPDPEGDPIQGATVQVLARNPADAEWVRSQLARDFPDVTVEQSAGPSERTVVMLWVPGPHGRVGTYTNHRCRDILCRTAWRQNARAMKDARVERARENPDIIPHGTAAGRTNYKCNCLRCKAAHAEAAYDRKQRARLRGIIEMITSMGGTVTAETGDEPAEVTVRSTLPTVDAAVEVSRAAIEVWANSRRQGEQVVFIVEAALAAALGLIEVGDGDPIVATPTGLRRRRATRKTAAGSYPEPHGSGVITPVVATS